MGTAVGQIHITQNAVHKRAGRVVPHVQLHQAQQLVHFALDVGFSGTFFAGFDVQAKGHVFEHRQWSAKLT